MTTPTATKTVGADRWRSLIPTETSGSLYVHVPFCKKKCPYCHFFVLPYRDELVPSYLESIISEWNFRKESLKEVSTVYFGGGTPSLLPARAFERLLKEFGGSPIEITLEVNPEDVTLEKMQEYRSIGINRISIGVQSLSDSNLQTIGRGHNASKALQAVELTAQAGFTNISIDLMYDLPSQTPAQWRSSIDRIKDLPITHLSLYNLIFEEGSLYFKKRREMAPLVPKEESSLEMLEYALERLERFGFTRYEISAFCREDKVALHNVGYWIGRTFIGIGPSAFSYVDGRRFRNVCHAKKWEEALANGLDPIDFTESLPFPDNIHEKLAVELRVLSGVDLDHYLTLPATTHETLERLEREGYIHLEGNRARLSNQGTLFYDHVASELV